MDNHKSFSENSISETRDLKFSKEEDNIEIIFFVNHIYNILTKN